MLKICLGGLCVAFYFVAVTLSGCGGGGGDGDGASPGIPVLQGSLTTTYDFEYVTLGNSPAAKVITLSNNGNAALAISNIDLIELGNAGFILDLDSGVDFCGTPPQSLAAGESCDVAVGFAPTEEIDYSGTLSVSSNDPDNATMEFSFIGTGVAVTVPTVQINRVESDTCPSSELSIYLAVTDQLGYPIVGLTESEFTVSETFGGLELPMLPITSSQTNESASISVALVMDYSDSITDHPEVQAGMEDGVISFINGLGDNDEAEIVKFDSLVEVVQPFTDGKDLLIAAVVESWDGGRFTRFNDALYQAVDDLALQSKDRRILILLSDGFNSSEPPSIHTYDEAKAYAMNEGVHVFTVGIASQSIDLNEVLLDSLATDTGGQYFDTLVADDLNTIYQQLAQIIFVDQYLLTYDSEFNSGDSVLLKVGVTAYGNTGEDSLDIVPCP